MKYLSLYWAFFKASFTADLEFRLNFLTRIVADVFWYVAQIVSFEVIYRYTNTIGDWTHAETRVFLGVLFTLDALYMVMFHDNLDHLSEVIRKGSLDLLLAKPISSQFMISCQRISTAHIGNLLLSLGWLFWSLSGLEGFLWTRILWLVILIPSGLTIFYGLRFMFSTSAVIFTRAENIQYLWYHLYRLGMRPDNIYYPWLKFLLLTVLPVGLIASVPSRVVLSIGDFRLAFWCFLMACLLLFSSRKVWHWALKYYTSASS